MRCRCKECFIGSGENEGLKGLKGLKGLEVRVEAVEKG